ncbi:MAG TPA: hypothetical protein VGG98_08110 [Solirubrobacteraceae bacterium]
MVLFAALMVSSAAFAESPWWHLGSSARPTNLHPGSARNEVQDVMVTTTEGDFVLAAFSKGEFKSTKLPITAKPEEVQKGLETVYGPGNVAVTGSKPYEVTFRGSMMDQPVPLMLAGGATVTEAVLGRPDGQIVVTAANLGDAPANGETIPVRIVDKLPPVLTAVSIEAVAGREQAGEENRGPVECSLESPAKGVCTFGGTYENGGGKVVAKTLPPYDQIEVRIGVVARAGASSSEVNEVSVSGGQAAGAFVRRTLRTGGEPSFGVENYELLPEEESGSLDTQAGSHPFQLTGSFDLNQTADANPVALPKDVLGKLPPGLIGNPTPLPQCTLEQFDTLGPKGGAENLCSSQTAVGVAIVAINEPHLGLQTWTVPVFNVEPAVGEPARFGFSLPGTPILLDVSVRAGGDYGVTLGSSNISQTAALLAFKLIFWGVPGDARHDNARGWGCLQAAREVKEPGPCHPLETHHPPPFVVLPTSCTGPLPTSLESDSWQEPKPAGQRLEFPGEPMVAMDGCNRLPFSPGIIVTPDGTQASKPTGLNVDVHVPQNSVLTTNGFANSNIKDITVKLPAGVAINPSSGDGLETCSEGLVGFEGFKEFNPFSEPGLNTPLFKSYLPGSVAAKAAVAAHTAPETEELLEQGKNSCPNASKVAEVTIKTPLLPNPLKGFVYLAAQEANPFGSVLAMYIVAEDPVSGSLVKLPERVTLCQGAGEVIAGETCEAAGQLVATVEDNPQLPFEDAELHFFGGERAPLASPSRCGTYTTTATYVPWSGTEPVKSQSSFQITTGPNGSPCTYPGQALPFSPLLTGGATNVNAGAFSPFTLTMTRQDGEQNLQSVEAHLPPGLSGILSNIELCPETQASQGTCGPNSLIGETTVSVGVGGEPFTVKGGKFYLTGPYNGTGGCTVGTPGCAPFGVTFVVPAKAGPFDFAKTKANHPACDCVLVRGKIEINPLTAAITITSNPPGTPDAIPTSIEGIPLEIQHVNAITTRPNFQFNPTNCSKMEVTGTIHSSEGGTDTIGVPFQVTNCAVLGFKPKFKVSTSGKTSRSKGASLTAKLTYPKAPFGSQANIARVKVALPKQLPSRLTTLQKACTAAQFNANPAGCPAASVIGHAKAITPILPVPLEGPAIFVSHGGEAFPSLIVVLQGYGVTIDLVGSTFISKAGITSSTFKTVPDQPVTSFELTLPEGKFSALAANGNLCKVKSGLKMPTEFVAQNGAVIHQNTKIAVTGCHKHKAKRTKKADKRKHAKHRKK